MSAQRIGVRGQSSDPEFVTNNSLGQIPKEDDDLGQGFSAKKKVRWLNPGSYLLRHASRILFSVILEPFIDVRAMQAAGQKPIYEDLFEDLDDDADIWIDFAADIGDGWDATYSIAYLMGLDALPLATDSGDHEVTTQRAHLQVLGGDIVYPAARLDEYRSRFLFPYSSARPLPRVDSEARKSEDERDRASIDAANTPRYLFAIPGNHDWYDLLSGFRSIMTTGRRIGDRITKQTRSYFACKLSEGWWLLAIDTGLNEDLDQAQRQFFRELVTEGPARGARIILCVARPWWVYRTLRGTTDRKDAVQRFEEYILEFGQVELVATIAGDQHHYARYEQTLKSDGGAARGVQRITCGSGGAYLTATHSLPDALSFDHDCACHSDTDGLKCCYPSEEESRDEASYLNCVKSILKNGALWWFFAFLLGTVGLAAWIFQAGQTSWALVWAVIGLLALIGGMGFFTRRSVSNRSVGSTWLATFLGASYGVAQWVLAIAAALASHAAWQRWATPFDPMVRIYQAGNMRSLFELAAFGLSALVIATLVSLIVFMSYMVIVSYRFDIHTNEIFASLSIDDRKGFLRMKLDRSHEGGRLSIYPIKLDHVGRAPWVFSKESWSEGSGPWYTPENELQARLIEEPIELPQRDR